MPETPEHPENIIALDFGMRRIGVATGACITGMASALTTVLANAGQPDWNALDAILREWQPDILVLGLPFNTDGSDSEMTARVRQFAAELEERYQKQVSFIDERYTSAEAEALLKEERRQGTRTRKINKADVDAKAAQLIAESWMQNTKTSP
ncbi:MAG: Holliday junction resolvase RuvX [Gammaproteobacteria bacterium]